MVRRTASKCRRASDRHKYPLSDRGFYRGSNVIVFNLLRFVEPWRMVTCIRCPGTMVGSSDVEKHVKAFMKCR